MNKRQFKKYCKKEVVKAEIAIRLVKDIDWNAFGEACSKLANVIADVARKTITWANENQDTINKLAEQQKLRSLATVNKMGIKEE